jgi:hypothetical protein
MNEGESARAADAPQAQDADELQPEAVSHEGRGDLPSATVSAPADDEADTPLLPAEQLSEFERQWQQVQAGFVDEPRRAVEEADGLVADLSEKLAASFSESRSRLETQWDRGDDASTEELRLALMRYRSFFKRLLSA